MSREHDTQAELKSWNGKLLQRGREHNAELSQMETLFDRLCFKGSEAGE